MSISKDEPLDPLQIKSLLLDGYNKKSSFWERAATEFIDKKKLSYRDCKILHDMKHTERGEFLSYFYYTISLIYPKKLKKHPYQTIIDVCKSPKSLEKFNQKVLDKLSQKSR